jgi:hypothetical protein
MLAELNDKNADIEIIAGQAINDGELLAELLEGLKSKNETYRYNCYKVIYSISRTHGEVLYPFWDTFAKSLGSANSYHKMAAVHLLANLTAVDKENRFEKIFDKYYSLLDDKSMVVAYYVANVSGKIVKSKPELQKAITSKLLGIDKTHHQPGRKELIKTGVIEAFNEYVEKSDDKEIIIDFVRQQLTSESSKTRKTAKVFLAEWNRS